MKTEKEIIKEFREKTDRLFDKVPFNGMTPAEIEEDVRTHIERVVYDYDLDVEIVDVIITGSRCRGLENGDSDLDVVLYFAGTNRGYEREDDLFNFLHEEGKLYLDDIEVDINPISNAKRETLADYLLEAEKYLEEKKKEKRLMNTEEIKNALEEVLNATDFSLTEISGVDGKICVNLDGDNPCGEDWQVEFAIDLPENTQDLYSSLSEKVYEYYENYDIEEEVYLLLEAKRNGLRGVPDVVNLVHNEEYKVEALYDLYEELDLQN